MKKNFLLFCFFCSSLLLSNHVYSQIDTTSLNSEQQEIYQAFTDFFLAFEQRDNEKLLDMTYPKLFDIVPKEDLLTAINGMYADKRMSILIHDSVIEGVSKSIEKEGAKYAIVDYSFEMTMIFNDLKDEEEDETNFDVLELTYDMLSISYGKENISLNKENHSLQIKHLDKKTFAIQESNADSWTFLENKKNTAPFLEKLLPKEVIEAAKPPSKACVECSSFRDALVKPKQVTSLIMNPNLNTPNLKNIPSSIGELVNLEILYLTEHSLNEVPEEIGNLKKLKELSLAGCQLKTLPDEIFTLQKLDELLLFDNQFSKRYLKQLKKKFKKMMPKTKVFLNSDDFYASFEDE